VQELTRLCCRCLRLHPAVETRRTLNRQATSCWCRRVGPAASAWRQYLSGLHMRSTSGVARTYERSRLIGARHPVELKVFLEGEQEQSSATAHTHRRGVQSSLARPAQVSSGTSCRIYEIAVLFGLQIPNFQEKFLLHPGLCLFQWYVFHYSWSWRSKITIDVNSPFSFFLLRYKECIFSWK
jgi:hypothetical protein